MSAITMIRKPFKGSFFYEWQIGPFVFQVRHNDHRRAGIIIDGLPLFKVWRDSQWKR